MRELFETILGLAQESSEKNRKPYSCGKRDPKLRYDQVIVAALLVFKAALEIDNATLIKKNWELDVDARLSSKARYKIPQDTQLRAVIGSEEFLD